MKYRHLIILILLLMTTVVSAATLNNIKNNVIVTGSGGRGYDANSVMTTAADRKHLGLDNTAAKAFLKSRYSRATMAKGCVKSADKAINGLNAKFAQCAANFLQGWEKQHGRVRISSAFRDNDDQRCVCRGAKGLCAKPGRSRHQRGDAMDVWPTNLRDIPKFHAAARAFGGVVFNLGMRDRPHMVASGAQCGKGGAPGLSVGAMPKNEDNAQPSSQGEGGQGQGEQSQEQQKQSSQPPKGGSGGSPQQGVPEPENPYSKAGKAKNKDPYGIWGTQSTTTESTKIATLSCSPSTISGTERSLISWRCGGTSTRSRGGTTRRNSRFNTKGLLSGKGYAHPRESTSYKVQCFSGDTLIDEAICKITTGTNNANNTLPAPSSLARDAVLRLYAEHSKVGWGGHTRLKWATLGASNCRLSGGRLNATGERGLIKTGRIYYPTTFMLSCDTSSGTKTVKTFVKIW